MDNFATEHKHDKAFIVFATIGLALVIIMVFVLYFKNQYKKVDDLRSSIVYEEGSSFADLPISAKAAVVWDVKNKRFLYEKNEQDVLPLASLTKLMTTLAAAELVPENTQVRIADQYSGPLDERDPRLAIHKVWDIFDLISYTLLTSSNGGSKAIATVAGSMLSQKDRNDAQNPRDRFVEYINTKAKDLGLNSVRFYNDSGLDVNEEQSGGYGNAKDVAYLMGYILSTHPELLESTKHGSQEIYSDNNIPFSLKNTNVIVEQIPGVLASKTGSTDLAQANLAVAFSPGLEGPYIAVILGSSFEERFNDMSKLVSATIENVSK